VRFEVPSLAKGMKDVYKVGGWPLAALLVVALIALALVGQGLFAQAASLIKTISLFVAISSVVVLLVLTVLGYLRWKTEVGVYRDSYNAELELQDKFLLSLLQYASTVGGPNALPGDRKALIEAIGPAIGGLMQQMIDVRSKLRLISATSRGSEQA